MRKLRIAALDLIRGLSMLGVIGIHTGSQYLANPWGNVHLVALLEIATRFSVPIFFFISAFGLFYQLDPAQPFRYWEFLRRRCRAVCLPYFVWSALYLLHYTFTYGDPSFWWPGNFLRCMFFGLACYHLYFLVLLLWFYLLMPLWVHVAPRLTVRGLFWLLLAQIAFDAYSSFYLSPGAFPPWLRPWIEFRLNYWVLHYAFVFLLGAYAALHADAFLAFLQKRFVAIAACFFASFALLLGYYYYLLYAAGYPPEGAINTAHQLSPPGILYTLAACLFFFALFTFGNLPAWLRGPLAFFGKHSYFVYLFHPFALTYLTRFLQACGFLTTAPVVLLLYLGILLVSLLCAVGAGAIGRRFPIFALLLTGSAPQRSAEKD